MRLHCFVGCPAHEEAQEVQHLVDWEFASHEEGSFQDALIEMPVFIDALPSATVDGALLVMGALNGAETKRTIFRDVQTTMGNEVVKGTLLRGEDILWFPEGWDASWVRSHGGDLCLVEAQLPLSATDWKSIHELRWRHGAPLCHFRCTTVGI